MAQVRLLCGTRRSDRERSVDRFLCEAWGRAILLVPTRRYATCRAERIILGNALEGAWGRPVQTIDDFAEGILLAEGRAAVRITDFERRLLFQRTLDQLRENGALRSLGAAAETQGFVSHILRLITQLKQAAIEPGEFRRRVGAQPRHPFDNIVTEVYTAYQDALQRAGVYDLPGMFWEADLLCRERKPAALDPVTLLALDGFDDFTPSEFRLIAAFEKHVEHLVFGLNYDPKPGRRDLYAIPARTARKIHEHFGAIPESFDEEKPKTFTDFAADNLFWRDKPGSPEGLEPTLEILPCPDFVQEIETIGRRIKTLVLDDGVPVDAICVVYRDLHDAAPALRSVFSEFGIPVRIIQRPPLTESAIGAFLLTLLDALESWRREAIVDVLTSPWFASQQPYVETVPLLSRMARIIAGFEEWRNRLANLIARIEAGSGEDIAALCESVPDACEAAKATLARVHELEQLGRLLPAKASAAGFAEALDRLIDAAGLPDAIEAYPVPAIREYERAALAALRELLGRWRTWERRAPARHDDAQGARAQFVVELRQAMRDTAFQPPQPGEGVACLDLEAARLLRFDHVFFAGVNEGDVPRPPATNAIYAEEDLARLARAGIDIEGKRGHSEREALLFHHALDMARVHLCISWHAVSRGGKEKLPSPYVTDLRELFSVPSWGSALPGTIEKPMPPAHAFVPDVHYAASWRDIRNAVLCRRGFQPLLYNKGFQPLFGQGVSQKRLEASSTVCRAGARRSQGDFAHEWEGGQIETARHSAAPFDAYDGVLSDSETIATVAKRFDARHRFSVKQIEAYQACPFRFFVENVLRLAEMETPVAEFDARVRGLILHAVLEAFHEHYRGRAIAEIPEEEAAGVMRSLVTEVFEQKAWQSSTRPPGIDAVERERLALILGRYLSIERAREESEWKPSHFEVAFGNTRAASRDALDITEPFALDTEAGPVLFSGRIDRIDHCQEAVRIIDYKSSVAVTRKDIMEGRSVQLSIYAIALEEFLMKGTACREAFFLTVGREKRLEALGCAKNEWEARQQVARDAVAISVAAVRRGYFPPVPNGDVCRYCAAGRACRYEPGRIERKLAGNYSPPTG